MGGNGGKTKSRSPPSRQNGVHFEVPERESLGYLDETRWTNGPFGKEDPWKRMWFAPLLGEDGKLVSFNTSTDGGKEAVCHLAYVFTEDVRKHPGCLPVVELGTRSYENRRGPQFAPTLTIVGWTPAPGVQLSDGDNTKSSVDQLPAPEEPSKPVRDELDDDVPF